MPTLIPRERIAPRGTQQRAEWDKHFCPPGQPGFTPDLHPPDVVLKRSLATQFDLALPFRLPDGKRVLRLWIMEADEAVPRKQFPSAPVVVRQGQLVHATGHGKGNTHTIHWHGIEPTPMNDGVGKQSFEISGNYVYQWVADIPGTYFYHCHKNTPLHFEMGLWGGLIVDPPQGRGFVQAGPPLGSAPDFVIPYDVEAIWACGAFDWRWHSLGFNHAMARCGADPNDPRTFTQDGILNDWAPNIFHITGAVAPTPTGGNITDPRAAVTARVGQTILVRLINASLTRQRYTPGIDAAVIAEDGRAFGVPPFGSYSQSYVQPANTSWVTTSAMRNDLIIVPTAPGVYPFKVEYLHWTGRSTLATVTTNITVNP